MSRQRRRSYLPVRRGRGRGSCERRRDPRSGDRGGYRVVTVTEPGVLAAMCAGVVATTSDIVAFTDDDAQLTTTWAARVEELFLRSDHNDVGGVGGRDIIYDGYIPTHGVNDSVGVITYWVCVIGNHHCGTGPVRDVAMLKGVISAYRRCALGLPLDLHGSGAQAHFEVAVGRYAREHQWRLCYDPTLTVRHEPAVRVGDDQREAPSPDAVADSAYNLMRALPATVQSRRWLYVHLVGDRASPGLVRWFVAVLQGDRTTLARRAPAWSGTSLAWRQRRVPVTFDTFS